MIDIRGMKKAEVLKALYDNSKPLGMGFFQIEVGPMPIEEATELLEDQTYFDYLKGRVMKVDLRSDIEFEEWGYDRDNGEGAAQRVIEVLRKGYVNND